MLIAPDASPRLIDLALEPAFHLAGLEVHPAILEVRAAGRSEQLEPRIMQVLVELALRRGEVVSRDELIQTCWGGRVVGDDSVNRCISRLRKLAVSLGGFEIATVPRVGFRLTERLNAPAGLGSRRRYFVVLLAVVMLSAAALAGFQVRRTYWPAEPRLVVAAFTAEPRDADAARLAVSLADHLKGALAEDVPGLTLGGPAVGGSEPVDMVVGGGVSRVNSVWRVRVYLQDVTSGIVLWSGEFEGAGDDAALFDEVRAAVIATVYTAMAPAAQRGLKLDPRTLALYLRGSGLLRQPNPMWPGDARRAFEEVVERAPDFAYARGVLAFSFALEAGLTAAGDAALLSRARQQAMQSIRRSPNGAAYDALFQIERQEAPGDIARAENWLTEGVRKAPSFPVFMRECAVLFEVGLARDGVGFCGRAVALAPMAAPVAYHQARALAADGQTQSAKAVIDRAARFHPRHDNVRWTRLEMAAFDGDPDEALGLLHDPRTVPQTFDAATVDAFDAFLKARKTRAATDADRALARFRRAAISGPLEGRHLVMAAAALGRTDEAFAAAATWPSSVAESPVRTGYLFVPSTAAMRRDPRFWDLAARVHLVDYWRVRGVLPDFCSDPTLPYDCRQQMARTKSAAG